MPILIPELLLASCRKHGDRVAVSSAQGSLTYSELLGKAMATAGFLLSSGLSGRAVAIHGDKKPATYAALLGIWLSGNHFLPLPPGCPEERRRRIFDEAAPALLLDPGNAAAPAPASLPALEPSSLAYLAYTSGSSGRPKGCAISHANLLAWHEATRGFYDFSPADRISQVFELTFDPSVSDVLWAFLNGATLCPVHPFELAALGDFLARERVTVWSSSPSLARLALSNGRLSGKSFPHLRLSTFIGEKLTPELARAWRSLSPSMAVENLYGPAEATISVTRHFAPAGDPLAGESGSIPIGTPHPGTELALVPCEQGEELWIGGPQVSRGYLDPAQDSGRFEERALAGFSSRRWYRTGDLARALPGGAFLFLGRADAQLKVAGRRFEPGELEAVARGAGFPHAYALPWPDAQEASGLVLAVEAEATRAQLDSLFAACEQALPSWAIPAAVWRVPSFPLGGNGKIDRAALLALVRALPPEACLHRP